MSDTALPSSVRRFAGAEAEEQQQTRSAPCCLVGYYHSEQVGGGTEAKMNVLKDYTHSHDRLIKEENHTLIGDRKEPPEAELLSSPAALPGRQGTTMCLSSTSLSKIHLPPGGNRD